MPGCGTQLTLPRCPVGRQEALSLINLCRLEVHFSVGITLKLICASFNWSMVMLTTALSFSTLVQVYLFFSFNLFNKTSYLLHLFFWMDPQVTSNWLSFMTKCVTYFHLIYPLLVHISLLFEIEHFLCGIERGLIFPNLIKTSLTTTILDFVPRVRKPD